jgi:hypothetical protein
MAVSKRTVGICLSGGGIRSTAFALGALQALQTRLGLLTGPDRATFMSAVSGGSYTAAAFSLVAGGVLDTPTIQILDQDAKHRINQCAEQRTDDGRPIGADGHPYWTKREHARLLRRRPNRTASKLSRLWYKPFSALYGMRLDAQDVIDKAEMEGWQSLAPSNPMMPGTPESAHLRNHARYMAEPSGVLLTLLSLLFRVVLSMLFVVLSVMIIGVAFGLVNRMGGWQQYDPQARMFVPREDFGPLWAIMGPAMGLIIYLMTSIVIILATRELWKTMKFRRVLALELSTKDIARREYLQYAIVFLIACRAFAIFAAIHTLLACL